jgi:hypothetical protein
VTKKILKKLVVCHERACNKIGSFLAGYLIFFQNFENCDYIPKQGV